MTSEDGFSERSDEALAAAYRGAASEYGRCSADEGHTEANRQAERLAAAYRELRRRGVESQRQILQLLGDEDESVRSWAGAHALEFASERGEAVLSTLADGSTVAAFNARMTLREWRAGRLSFP